ncbi:hypothetical protein SAMN04515663_10390 [Alcanivorax sp. DSM 26293]|uniref:YbcC family protein n=1 Tax=Alcanivorax sp. DSM 26293 TaxID=1798238 RepID=UPI0008A001C7|nr:DUF2309 domain-containing protein [Alcanivorax sp. DSM 26293]SEF74528.1 hypothetical protein SAMN04515663_10390 [Alcanivorax sp. DSM 26293]
MSTQALADQVHDDGLEAEIEAAIQTTVSRIAPTWPLDRMIAVNPYWGHRDLSFMQTATQLARLAGSPMALDASDYRDAWQAGDIDADALAQARDELAPGESVEALLDALETPAAPLTPAPLLSDTLDKHRDLQSEPAWCDTITHQISQFCAAYFDHHQSQWRPSQSAPLYPQWRNSVGTDHGIAMLMKAPQLSARASQLATQPREQIRQAIRQLGIPREDICHYLQAVLARISGWAAWCAYRNWEAQLAGEEDDTLVHLLAIRLSWECLIDGGSRAPDAPWTQWQGAWSAHLRQVDTVPATLIWQRAQEIHYQRSLIRNLTAHHGNTDPALPQVQAAFCIDVRSEVFRRHLEAQSPHIHTLGFAGFFGLPIRYEPLGTDLQRPQLPGLLSPAMTVTDTSGSDSRDQAITRKRQSHLRNHHSWSRFKAMPLSGFVLVESLGLGYLFKLIKQTLPSQAPLVAETRNGLSSKDADALSPRLDSATAGDTQQQAELACRILTGMGLTSGFAPLVLLLGHGSQTRNNPHQAALDCGACCGQSGDVNARTLANLLNDPAVRERMQDAGIAIPDSTHFLAGLHNTLTEEVTLFDLARLPESHRDALASIQQHLRRAQSGASAEKATRLGLAHLQDKPDALSRALRHRANDWSQTRPEWALANNAAMMIAPRSRTRGLDLQGRSFLHDYDYRSDPDGERLEQIMTAPMVVANWINMQYFASTVDNLRFGSGNKTLHNVVGGKLGVFEGNGGDLRIGLPIQSVHDGEHWQHTPVRLSVFIEAPREMIAQVIEKHEVVRQLVNHQWLYLFRVQGEQVEQYQQNRWIAW